MGTMKTLVLLVVVLVSIIVVCGDVFTSLEAAIERLEEGHPLRVLAIAFGFISDTMQNGIVAAAGD